MNMETDDLLSSMMLWNGAEAYVKAARILFEHDQDKASSLQVPDVPAYFVVCQAIELDLKAYLRGRGESESFLANKCGHDLVKALQAAEERGLKNLLKFEPAERSILESANKLFNSKALQFPIAGRYRYPRFELLLQIAEKLVAKTEAFCMANVECHAGKPTAVLTLRSAREK
jgi:hypothetical protein